MTKPEWLERAQLLTLEQTADILNISKATLYRILGTGELPWVQVGSTRRLDPQDLYAYIQKAKHFEAPPSEDTL